MSIVQALVSGSVLCSINSIDISASDIADSSCNGSKLPRIRCIFNDGMLSCALAFTELEDVCGTAESK